MLKTTGKSGFRASRGGGGGAGRRVNAAVLTDTSAPPGLRRVAFLPDTVQESTFDSNSPRLGGLEKIA